MNWVELRFSSQQDAEEQFWRAQQLRVRGGRTPVIFMRDKAKK